MSEASTELSSRPEPVFHVRADRSDFDIYNLFVVPFRELLRYQSLIKNIIARDLKVRYKRSFFGIAWTVLAPLMSMLVLWAVFTYAMKVQIPYYAAYLLSGIISWNLFLQSSVAGAASILNNSGLIQKIRLPRVVFPITVVVNNLVNFSFAFVALLLVIVVIGAPLHLTLFAVPLAILPLLIFCMGWSMMVSSLAVFFRDLQYILEISLGALFYLTPILYQPEALPPKVKWIVSLNPMAKYIHLFRVCVYTGELPSLRVYLISLALGVTMFLVGWLVFQRLQRRFVYWL